jgi:hypothetical protein
MKHLRKYNENIEEKLDIEYLTDCFIDLIDAGAKKQVKVYGNPAVEEFTLDINLPEIVEKKNINLKEYIDNEKKRIEIYEEAEYSLEKVAIKYPDLKIDISTSRFTGIGTINNNLSIKIVN